LVGIAIRAGQLFRDVNVNQFDRKASYTID
jgi:hypothetical protein